MLCVWGKGGGGHRKFCAEESIVARGRKCTVERE